MVGIIGLSGQPLTAFGSTVYQDFASADGRFAGAEPMAALADQHAGLKCALHCNTLRSTDGWKMTRLYKRAVNVCQRPAGAFFH